MRAKGARSAGRVPVYAGFAVLYCLGYFMGFLTKDKVTTSILHHDKGLHGVVNNPIDVKWPAMPGDVMQQGQQGSLPGDSIHSLITSSGDSYMNWQTRILYASYMLVQQMHGGERLTGFTRILHRTAPDVLMDEVPTYWVRPWVQCDEWTDCDYPVANRPPALRMFFMAAAQNRSMIQGAWVLLLETDYVWMKPLQAPGSAYDPSVPGVQYLFDYIRPKDPKIKAALSKLYPGVGEVPASGPAPVLMRLDEWLRVVPMYTDLAMKAEDDAYIQQALAWVREMYAWDVSINQHPDIKLRSEKPPHAITIVQPPYDEQLGPASLCHYTWPLRFYHGKPSQGGTLLYRWDKRQYNNMTYVLQPDIFLMGNIPVNAGRYRLAHLTATQINRAIATLPDLTEHYQQWLEQQPPRPPKPPLRPYQGEQQDYDEEQDN